MNRGRQSTSIWCALTLVILAAGACHGHAAHQTPAPKSAQRTVIVLGFDGFARRYLDSDSAPTFHMVARTGVTAKAMIPSVPSITFPNFYALATGLYPDHSGIIANTFYDPAYDSAFAMKSPRAHEGHWWGGEPIWVTAEKAGVRSATMFWVGSEARVEGMQPSTWHYFDHSMPFPARVDSLLTWLDRAPPAHPRLVMGYFEEPDGAGHHFGPDAPQTRAAVLGVDSALAQLIAGLERRHIYDSVDLVLVADHGMDAIDSSRVVYLDDVVDSASVRVVSLAPLLLISARDGNQDALLDRLHRLPHVRAWRKENVPARLHYGTNPRITPVVGVADEGWMIAWRHGRPMDLRGEHGYDNAEPNMRALFIAHGPDFRPGTEIDAFPNVDVYDLLAHLLGVAPAKNDGTLAPFEPVLR